MKTNLKDRLHEGETIQDMEIALSQKLEEGESLLLGGHPGGAIYLMGYAVEMTLKAAYFTYSGGRPADPVQPNLAPAVDFARGKFPAIVSSSGPRSRHYHDLRFWGFLLRERRRRDGNVWPPDFDARYLNAIRLLDRMWSVEMRYKPDQARVEEAIVVKKRTQWLAQNRRELTGRRS